LSGKQLIELTKEKILELREKGIRIHDKRRGGYYEGRPISKTQLSVILEKHKVSLDDLRAGKIKLDLMERIEEEIIASSLKNWTIEEVKRYFPVEMKEPVATCILISSNLGVDRSKLDEFFLK